MGDISKQRELHATVSEDTGNNCSIEALHEDCGRTKGQLPRSNSPLSFQNKEPDRLRLTDPSLLLLHLLHVAPQTLRPSASSCMTPSPRPLSPRVAPGTAIQPGWLPPRTRTALGSDIPDRLETRIDVNRGRGAQRQSYTEYSERNLMVRAVTNVSTFYGRSFQSWVCCCLSAVVAATAKLVRMLSRSTPAMKKTAVIRTLS
ncbi:hypothetical protein IWX91DRAFT_196909 [Phyllosticta citricarpa]